MNSQFNLSQKKTVVIIQEFACVALLIKQVLEKQGFDAIDFSDFNEASNYLKENTPDLIITDLKAGNCDIDAVRFYIKNVMERRLNFSLWTGYLNNLDFENEKDINYFSAFLNDMPKNYKITFDPKQAVTQKEVDILVHDYQTNENHSFPAFIDPHGYELENILDFFKLNVNGFVILYIGLFSEAQKLSDIL